MVQPAKTVKGTAPVEASEKPVWMTKGHDTGGLGLIIVYISQLS